MNTLQTRLRDFKLAGIYANLDERLSYAKERSLSHIEFLELLVEDEFNSRKDHGHKKRYMRAKLPAHKTHEDFDFSFQPSIDKKLFNDALTCQFIREKRSVVFIGNPGTGKTHYRYLLVYRLYLKGLKCFLHQFQRCFTI